MAILEKKLSRSNPEYAGLHETIHEMSLAGEKKIGLGSGQVLILGFLAGVYLVFATTLSIVSAAGLEPLGLKKLIMGAVFPVGLIAIVMGGAELFTGNVMLAPVAALSGRSAWSRVAYNWTGSFAGNFLGSLFGAYLIIQFTNVLPEAFLAEVRTLALAKVSHPWAETFWRGFACVWLVDLAVYLAGRVKEPVAKFLLIWFPTMTFFTIGFEHSVVNMFLIPAGILAGAPITWGQFLWNNLVPVTLGNTMAGLFMVGFLYWYISGMPLLKSAAQTGGACPPYPLPDYVFADHKYLWASLGKALSLVLGFTALLPGVPALFTYVFLEGMPQLMKSASAAGQPLPGGLNSLTPFLLLVYFIFVLVIAAKNLRR